MLASASWTTLTVKEGAPYTMMADQLFYMVLIFMTIRLLTFVVVWRAIAFVKPAFTEIRMAMPAFHLIPAILIYFLASRTIAVKCAPQERT